MSVVILGAGEARNNAINTVSDELMQEIVDNITEFADRGKFECTIDKPRTMGDALVAAAESLRDYGYEYETYLYEDRFQITIKWYKAPYDK